MPENDNPPPPPRAILEAALYVDDLDAAAEFYGARLGLSEIARVPGRHVFFRVGAAVLLIFDATATARPPRNPALPVPPHGAHGPGHICFAVPGAELDAWQRKLTENSIAIEADFVWPNGARSIYFRDPAGNSIELAEPQLWSDQ